MRGATSCGLGTPGRGGDDGQGDGGAERDPGRVGGAVGAAVTTAYALTREAVRHDVTVTAVDRNGAPIGPGTWNTWSTVNLVNLDTRETFRPRFTGGTATARVPEGRYNLGGELVTPASGTASRTSTLFLQPELELRGDTRLAVDAREGRQLTVTVPGRATTGGTRRRRLHRRADRAARLPPGTLTARRWPAGDARVTGVAGAWPPSRSGAACPGGVLARSASGRTTGPLGVRSVPAAPAAPRCAGVPAPRRGARTPR
ncbi:hypothetical protein ACGF0D_38200 [Kitasatospora sp. NPDC048298]|uniref:hypothetical protein n=1 Tax=Kitasatospora sp. NPDC048298 TaxID=3364049 RepID=UPI0037130AFD